MTSDPCTSHPDVDWLFDAPQPDDSAWLARVRAEIAKAPVIVREPRPRMQTWARGYDCCRICGTTEGRSFGHGRCNACNRYWKSHGVERPARYWQKDRAS